MITIKPLKTQLEINLEKIDAPLILVENSIKAAIQNLNASYNFLWSLPDDQIEEIMNYKGIFELQRIFEAHFKYANGFNELLQDRGISEPRAITIKPRDFSINEDGVISLVPLTEPEIVEENEPIDLPEENP